MTEPSPPATRKRKLPADGWQLIWTGQVETALRRAKRSFISARDTGDVAGMAAGLGQIALCCALLGAPEDGLDCALAAKRLWRRSAEPAEEAQVVAIEAFLLFDLGLSDEGFEAADEAVAIAGQLSDLSVLALASCMRGIALALCRQPELALPVLRESIRIAGQCGDRLKLPFYLLNLGFCFIKLADGAEASGDEKALHAWLEQAIEATEDAIAVAMEAGNSWCLRAALGNVAELYARVGDLERAQERLATWAAIKGRPGSSLKIQYLYTLGDVLTRQGRLPEALKAGAEALALAEKSGQTDHQLNATAKLAEAHEAMGDLAAALEMQKRFHGLYVRQSGETTQRRAKVAEIRLETERLRVRADELANQAMRDGLTGISNRRAFDAEMAQLEGKSFAVAMLDLDHFKAINDRFSHMVGDEVLRRLAQVLTRHAGTRAARLGGEEFALLLAEMGREDAERLCEVVRVAIEGTAWDDLAPELAVTVSIGLAVTAGGETAGKVMAAADRRLYGAKAAGRNRVVANDEPVRRRSAARRSRQG